jgi:uncharacterized membrane protein HdeD (DUF308 family)
LKFYPLRQNEMKLKKIAFWGFLLAGVLYVIAGLRDIFAPGFFNMSPHIPSKGDIAMQFILAGVFFAMAALYHKMKDQPRIVKK